MGTFCRTSRGFCKARSWLSACRVDVLQNPSSLDLSNRESPMDLSAPASSAHLTNASASYWDRGAGKLAHHAVDRFA